ncbi:hypothetical protein CVT26_005697 [Gymnopilus dilepis]|uniref:Nephrocystin 3-like N-terminal domain-containing protein n=1 Tax=Gymnopilus dilepis TaxID=231916 RepID=A0A409YSE7_9AGAR|nr:hypothetical protein CVT26_005697 [Gymnopilus dilepis]
MPEHTRKRDKIFGFLSGCSSASKPPSRSNNPSKLSRLLKFVKDFIHSPSHEPRHLSEGTTVTEPRATIPSSQSQPADTPSDSRKPFTKSKSFEKDIALLHASFILHEDSRLKEVILLILEICDNDKEDRLAEALETCTRFVVRLAEAAEGHQVGVAKAIADFKKTIENVKAQIDEDATCSEALSSMVNGEINKIEPPFLKDNEDGSSQSLSKFIDVALSSSIHFLSLVQSASCLVPVPCIQPVVEQIVVMLQAISQTRSNYDKMTEIVDTAGAFAVSCAVICSESSPGPSPEFRRALDNFTKKLETVAQECNALSRCGLFSRYLKQGTHASDLQDIKERLQNAIQVFQTDAQLSIKMDTDVLKRNTGFISDWISNTKEPVLWIHSAAGLGKSTVAQQLIHLLQDNNLLAGGVLLTLAGKEHSSEIIRMIAKQLGEEHPRAVGNIAEAARTVPMLLRK